MAGRPPRKPINEQIANLEAEIVATQERLISLKNQKKELEAQKIQQEMQQLYDRMKEQGFTIEEAMNALTKYLKKGYQVVWNIIPDIP